MCALVDPDAAHRPTGSTPLRSAQDDTRWLYAHKSVGVGALDDPFFNQILFFKFNAQYLSFTNIKALIKMKNYAKITKKNDFFIKFMDFE